MDGRARAYEKAYRGRNLDAMLECPPDADYKIAYPTNVVITGHAELAEV